MRPVLKRLLAPLAVTLIAAGLAPGAAGAQVVVVDTLVGVRPDVRVEIHNMNGSIEVGAWDQESVRIVARARRGVPVRIDSRGAALVVQSPESLRRGASIDYDVTVPRSAAVEVHGQNSPVTISGVGGRVEVHTINGPVAVSGGRDRVEVHSVNGGIEVTGARGSVVVHTINQGAVVREVVGDVKVSAVNGSVTLERVDSRAVEATNVQGTIRYVGTIYRDGVYRLSSHNGGIVMTLACDASARVTVSTFNGTLQSDCPVTLVEGPKARRFDITLGAGEAQIELTSFNGKIELRRP